MPNCRQIFYKPRSKKQQPFVNILSLYLNSKLHSLNFVLHSIISNVFVHYIIRRKVNLVIISTYFCYSESNKNKRAWIGYPLSLRGTSVRISQCLLLNSCFIYIVYISDIMWVFASIPVSKSLVDLPGILAVIIGDFARILTYIERIGCFFWRIAGELMLVMFVLGAFLYMLLWITADDPASTSAELGRCQAQMSILKLELDLERQKAISRSAVNVFNPDAVDENVKKAAAEVKMAEDRRFTCRLKNLKYLKAC
jgi:hypothetical protein